MYIILKNAHKTSVCKCAKKEMSTTLVLEFCLFGTNIVLQFAPRCGLNLSSFDSEGTEQPKKRRLSLNTNIEVDLMRKKTISTPLMMEKPVRSPMVPPMRLNWASVLIFLSLSMLSKVAVSKKISTNWRVEGGSSSPEMCTV